MTKFYFAENSNRTIVSKGIGFNFEPVQHFAGTWRGVFEAKTDEHIAALDELTADKRSAVVEISEAEYRKKKSLPLPNLESYQPLPQAGNTSDQRVIPGTAVLVENPSPSVEPEPVVVASDKPVENAEAAVKVGKVRRGGK